MKSALKGSQHSLAVGMGMLVLLLTISPTLVPVFAQESPDPSNATTLDEERLTQKITEAVMKEIREGEWLAQEIELGIAQFIKKQEVARQKARADQTQKLQEMAKNVQPISPTRDHVTGNPNAVISLIEYSDFECPYCKRFHATVKKVIEESDGKVNWVYRHYPLPFHNPNAQKEAEASECAAALGDNTTFWKYTDAIYTRTTSGGKGFPMNQLVPLAVELGLEGPAFQECLDSGQQTERVNADLAEGKRIGITGTPGSIIRNNQTGEVRMPSGAAPPEALKALIAQLLEPPSPKVEH